MVRAALFPIFLLVSGWGWGWEGRRFEPRWLGCILGRWGGGGRWVVGTACWGAVRLELGLGLLTASGEAGLGAACASAVRLHGQVHRASELAGAGHRKANVLQES